MRAIFISDTHLRDWVRVPDGDLLVHCGDAMLRGTAREFEEFDKWFSALPHKHKVFVPGNHDWFFFRQPEFASPHYEILVDREITVEGKRIWGSPWQPEFMGWAFNLPRGRALREHWDKIPEGLDLLVTHAPPYGVLDELLDGDRVGDEDLLEAVRRAKPRVHAFGHIHCQGGRMMHKFDTTFINCAVVNENYDVANLAQVYEL